MIWTLGRIALAGAAPAAMLGAGWGAMLDHPGRDDRPMAPFELASDAYVASSGAPASGPPVVISSSTGLPLPPPGPDITGSEPPPTDAALAAMMDSPLTQTEQQYLASIKPGINPATGLPDMSPPTDLKALSAADAATDASVKAPITPAPTAAQVIAATYDAQEQQVMKAMDAAEADAPDVNLDATSPSAAGKFDK